MRIFSTQMLFFIGARPGYDIVKNDAIFSTIESIVQKHHPDANGSSLEAEEMVKLVNEAYGILKNVY